MSPDRDQRQYQLALDSFRDAVGSLCRDHGLSHEDLLCLLRDSLVSIHRDRPETRVLCNGLWGRFGLSGAFVDFCNQSLNTSYGIQETLEPDSSARSEFAGMVSAFGRKCLRTILTADERDAVYLYHSLGFARLDASDASSYVYRIASGATSGVSFAKTRDRLNSHVPGDVVRRLEDWCLRLETVPSAYGQQAPHELSFVDPGGGSDIRDKWCLQNKYSWEVLRFLMAEDTARHLFAVSPDLLPGIESDMNERFGLACASTPHCYLRVVKVPAGVVWTICSDREGTEWVEIA